MSGVRIVRTKGTRYSIDVTCPKCSSELVQENKSKEDKFYQVFALSCDNCRTTFSLGISLRTEQTSHPSGVKLEGSKYGRNADVEVSKVRRQSDRTGVYRSSPPLSSRTAERLNAVRESNYS